VADADLIYGLHAVKAALDAGTDLRELWVIGRRNDPRLTEILVLAERRGLTAQKAERDTLDRLVGTSSHQGVVARLAQVTGPAQVDIESLANQHGDRLLLLVLDGVQDPHNLGACLRTANAAGCHAVVVPRDRAVGLTPVVRKVASGAAEVTPLIQVTNLARTLRQLQELAVRIVGTDDQGAADLYATDLTGALAIVMGAEGEGMRRLTSEHCDALVRLPMAGSVSSLNVSVATGVTLFEAVRQRRAQGGKR
jgi:23S rRNA (guanosine2251-2'-O)-methyltransferase